MAILSRKSLSLPAPTRRGFSSAVFWSPIALRISLPTTLLADQNFTPAGASVHFLKDRTASILIAIWTYGMRRFAAFHTFFLFIDKSTVVPNLLKYVALLVSFPCFEISHFFFKLAYAAQQRRLRLLSSEDFFLEFYDRRVETGGVANLLQSLRQIECSLERAKAAH